MIVLKPVSEEFLYCDPECICDNSLVEEESHPCHLCYVADKLAASEDEIKRLRHEQ